MTRQEIAPDAECKCRHSYAEHAVGQFGSSLRCIRDDCHCGRFARITNENKECLSCQHAPKAHTQGRKCSSRFCQCEWFVDKGSIEETALGTAYKLLRATSKIKSLLHDDGFYMSCITSMAQALPHEFWSEEERGDIASRIATITESISAIEDVTSRPIQSLREKLGR